MKSLSSLGRIPVLATLLIACLSASPSAYADPAGAAAPEGWRWVDQAPIAPTADVPTDGFVDLGIALDGFGSCLGTLTPLDSVTISVTDTVGVVPGTLSLGGPFGRQNLRWTPESPFSPNATYEVTASADNGALLTDGCGAATGVVVRTGTFVTAAGPAAGPPEAVSTLELTAQQLCEARVFNVRFTYDGSPYVEYAAFDSAGPRPLSPTATPGGYLSVDDAADNYCLTLRATHLLTDETTDTQACVTAATTLEPATCPEGGLDPTGCSASPESPKSSGGVPFWPLGALAILVLWRLSRRR